MKPQYLEVEQPTEAMVDLHADPPLIDIRLADFVRIAPRIVDQMRLSSNCYLDRLGRLNAVVPVRRLLDEAGEALADSSRTLLSSGVPDILGAIAGIGAGAAAGAALIGAGAATGTAGAAALTSGLAFAGSLVGGGLLLGVALVNAPRLYSAT